AEETVAVGGVLITTLPAGVGRIVAAMLHREEVAYRIVQIALDIRAHRVAVARVIEVRMDVIKRVRCGGRIGLATYLPYMLASNRFNQAIERVVGVVRGGLDTSIAEVDRLLRIVTNAADVADRVVGVRELLHLAAGPAGGGQLRAVVGKVGGGTPGEEMR